MAFEARLRWHLALPAWIGTVVLVLVLLLCLQAQRAGANSASSCSTLSGQPCCAVEDHNSCALESLTAGVPSLIYPGNNAMCLDGNTPFFFEVFPGKTDRVAILLNGRGLCSSTSSIESSVYSDGSVCATSPSVVSRAGVFDMEDSRNRFRDYTIINIPDCSGDFFLGSTQRRGSDGSVYNQCGGNNVLSVLNWMAIQVRAGTAFAPIEDLVIVGMSYGSIGAQFWANYIISYLDYPMRSAVVLDSFVGVFPLPIGKLLAEFGACELPLWSDKYKAECKSAELALYRFVSDQLQTSPNIPFVFIQSSADSVQLSTYNNLAAEHNSNAIGNDDFATTAFQRFEKYSVYSNFLLYMINSNVNGYFGSSYLFTANYDGESALSLSAYDTDADLWTDSLNKWLGHLPLMIGESLYSVCGSNALCIQASIDQRYYIQKDTSGYMLEKDEEGLTTNSSLVKLINSIPRYSSNLQRVKHDFVNGDPMANRNNYLISNVAFPLATSSIALVAVFALLVYLLIRYVFSDLAIFSSDNKKLVSDVNREVVVKRAIEYTNLVHQIQFYVMVGIVATALGVYGNVLITQGVHTGENTLLWVNKEFQNVATESENMYLLVQDASKWLSLAEESCPNAKYINNNLYQYNKNIMYFGLSASSLASASLYYDELLHNWGYEVRIYFVWAVYCVATLILILFGISAYRSIKATLYAAIALSVLFVVVTSVFTFAYMFSLMLMSDFCTAPTDFTLKLLEEGVVRSTATYYLTCSGMSPTYEFAYDADYALGWIDYFSNALLDTQCAGNGALEVASANFRKIADEHMPNIEGASECIAYYQSWNALAEEGVCSDAFNGLFIVWMSQSITAICILLCCVIGIQLVPYFRKVDHSEIVHLLSDESTSSLYAGLEMVSSRSTSPPSDTTTNV